MADNTRELEFILRFKNEADAALKAAGVSLDGLGTSASKTVKPLSDSEAGINKNTKAAQGFTASAAEMAGAFASLVAGLYGVKSVIGVFGDAEEQLQHVKTLMIDNQKLVDQYAARMEELALKTGTPFVELIDGLNRTISAFGDADNAYDIFRIANETAVAGTATTADSLRLLGNVMKGAGDRTTEMAEKVSNMAFIARNLGDAELPDLAASIGLVVPSATAAGVAVEEIFATMSLVGTAAPTTAIAVQGLRASLAALTGPSKEMKEALSDLGIKGFKQLKERIEKDGLQGLWLQLAAAQDKAGGSIIDLIGQVEAQGLVLAITEGNVDEYRAALEAMYAAGGEGGARAKAFAVEMEGQNRKVGQASAALELLRRRFGEIFSGPVKGVAKFIAELGVGFLQLERSTQTAIVAAGGFITVFAALVPALAIIIANIVPLKAAFSTLFAPLSAALTLLLHPIAAVQAAMTALRFVSLSLFGVFAIWPVAIAAIATALYFLPEIFDALGISGTSWGKTMLKMWHQAKEDVRTFVNGTLALLDFFASSIGVIVVGIGETFIALGASLADVLISVGTAVGLAVTGDIDGATQAVEDGLVRSASRVGKAGKHFNDNIKKEWARTQGTDYVGTMAGMAEGLWDGLADAVGSSSAGQGVKKAFESAILGAKALPTLDELLAGSNGAGGGGGKPSKEEQNRIKQLSDAFNEANVKMIAAAASHRNMSKAYLEGAKAVEAEQSVTEAFEIALQTGFQVYRDAEGVVRGKTAADLAGYEAQKLLNDEVRKAKKDDDASKATSEFNTDLAKQIGLMKTLITAGSEGAEAYHSQKIEIEALNELMKENSDVTVDLNGNVHDLSSANGTLSTKNAEHLKQIRALLMQQEKLSESTDDLAAKYRDRAPQGFFDGLAAGFKELDIAQKTFGEVTQGLLTDTVASGVDAIAESLVSSKASFADWATGVLEEISKVIIKWLLMQAIMGAVKLVAGAIGGAIGAGANGAGGAAAPGSDGFGYNTHLDIGSSGNIGQGLDLVSPTLGPSLHYSAPQETGYMSTPANVQVVHNNYAQGVQQETNQRKGPQGEDIIEIITRRVSGKIIEESARGGGLDVEFRRRGVRAPGVHR